MTLALTSESLPLQATSLWAWLVECAEHIARAVRNALPMSPAEQAIYALASDLGGSVLDAADIADLTARLHALAIDERLLHLEQIAFTEISPAPQPTPKDLELVFVRVWGEGQLVRDCARLLNARWAFVEAIWKALRDQAHDLDVGEAVTEALDDFRTPAVIRSALRETLAGEVALLALLAPIIEPERWRCDPWLRRALLEQVRAASLAHLRLLTQIPDVRFPSEILPAEEHLDPDEIAAEVARLERYVLPAELRVPKAYAARVLDAVEGSSRPPPGVLALFAD